MMILLSLVCVIQACLTLWLYRKVTCMQAGILIANLGSRAEIAPVARSAAELEELTTRKEHIMPILTIAEADRLSIMLSQAAFHIKEINPAPSCLIEVLVERLHKESDRIHKLTIEEEDPSFDEQYQDPDPPDTSAMPIVIIGQ